MGPILQEQPIAILRVRNRHLYHRHRHLLPFLAFVVARKGLLLLLLLLLMAMWRALDEYHSLNRL